ncbi:M24 family metallopeptidase [bacterium]|nr:M24 family metallopeptidase [bacterium]
MAEKKEQTERDRRWPVLSEKERDRRWRRLRALMTDQGVECLVVFGLKSREQFDGYLTNDRTGGIAIFPLEGEITQLIGHPQDLVSHLVSDTRGEVSWVHDVRAGVSGAALVEVLKEKGYERSDIGIVGLNIYDEQRVEGYVPYNTWEYVLKNLTHARFHEMSQAFAELVLVKSDEEMKLVRRAAEIAELAAETMMEVTRPGVSESEIYASLVYQLLLHGANGNNVPKATPIILHSGPANPGWGPPIWLIRGQEPRIIQRGDLVQAEIFSRYGGLEAQVQMSVAIEPVDPVNRKCAEIARESYEAGLRLLRPGKTFGEVVDAMGEPVERAGAWHITPHIHTLNPLSWTGRKAVGMEKLPGIDKYKWKGPTKDVWADSVIPENTVWELEPNACLGMHRVNIGGTVILTEEGTVNLNVLPTEMRIID